MRSSFRAAFSSSRGIGLVGIPALVLGQHLLHGALDLPGLAQEVLPPAALGLRGIGGQLDTIDGEHLASDEALPIADHEDLGEDVRDGRGVIGDEGSDGAEVRLAVTAQRNEDDVLPASGFDAA